MDFKTIPEMIRDRAKKYQDRDVFRYRERKSKNIETKSWNELVAEFTQLSKVLLSQGYGHEDNIGIFSPNAPEWTVADLAILNIRAVVVPFFSTASKEQCKYIVDETKMKLMFVGDEEQLEKAVWLLDNTASLEAIVVFNELLTLTDARAVKFEDYLNTPLSEQVDLEKVYKASKLSDLATIIYTSGTTGEPKGVMLSNENFLYTFGLHVDRLDLSDKDLSMAFLPLRHIFERTWTF
jgi:long-chain acyl-CoA synthetase